MEKMESRVCIPFMSVAGPSGSSVVLVLVGRVGACRSCLLRPRCWTGMVQICPRRIPYRWQSIGDRCSLYLMRLVPSRFYKARSTFCLHSSRTRSRPINHQNFRFTRDGHENFGQHNRERRTHVSSRRRWDCRLHVSCLIGL